MDIIATFNNLESMLTTETGGPVHLVRIKGARWSYVAGEVPEEMPFVAPEKVMLSDNWALIFYPAEGHEVDDEQIKVLFKECV